MALTRVPDWMTELMKAAGACEQDPDRPMILGE